MAEISENILLSKIEEAKPFLSDYVNEEIDSLQYGLDEKCLNKGTELYNIIDCLEYKIYLDEIDDITDALFYKLITIIGGSIGSIKLDQTITFLALPTDKQIGDADFSPGATASSGLPVSYTSSNTSVATIVNGLIHIVGLGSTTITATQAGDATYNSASPVNRTLSIVNNATINYGFTSVNPDGNVTTINLPNNLIISSGVTQYTINFTINANLQYLVHREPITEPIKTIWINQVDYNFGEIPDSKYRAYVESGGFRYYYTRVLFPFYTGIYTIQFRIS